MYDLHFIQNRMLEIAITFDKFCDAHGLDYAICGGSLIGAVRHEGFIPWDDDFDVIMPRDDFNKFKKLWKDNKELSLITTDELEYYKVGTPAKLFDRKTKVREIDEFENGMPEYNQYGIFLDIFPTDVYPKTLIGRIVNRFLGSFLVAKSLSQFPMKNVTFRKKLALNICRVIPLTVVNSIRDWAISYVNKKSKYNPDSTFISYGVDTPFYNLTVRPNQIWPAKREFNVNNYVFKGPQDYEAYLSNRFGNYMALPPLEHRKQHIVDVKIEQDHE